MNIVGARCLERIGFSVVLSSGNDGSHSSCIQSIFTEPVGGEYGNDGTMDKGNEE